MNILQEVEELELVYSGEPVNNILEEGGLTFMIPLLFLLLLIVFLFLRGLKNNTVKNSDLIKSISLFSLAFGVLGFIIGMLEALQAISMANDIATPVLAAGVRIGMITPTFGLIIFLVGRLFDVVLRWRRE